MQSVAPWLATVMDNYKVKLICIFIASYSTIVLDIEGVGGNLRYNITLKPAVSSFTTT